MHRYNLRLFYKTSAWLGAMAFTSSSIHIITFKLKYHFFTLSFKLQNWEYYNYTEHYNLEWIMFRLLYRCNQITVSLISKLAFSISFKKAYFKSTVPQLANSPHCLYPWRQRFMMFRAEKPIRSFPPTSGESLRAPSLLSHAALMLMLYIIMSPLSPYFSSLPSSTLVERNWFFLNTSSQESSPLSC